MCWWMADYIFEALALGSRPSWTPRFLRAALICRHPETVGPRIMARLAQRLAVEAIQPECRATAEYVAALWTRRANGDEPAGSEWEAARQQADAARQQADAARQQADAARQQADAAMQQAGAAWYQAYSAWYQAYSARQQAKAAWYQAYAARQQQAYAARQQADAAMQQAKAARHQADAMGPQAHTTSAWQQWWSWCADMVCEELRS